MERKQKVNLQPQFEFYFVGILGIPEKRMLVTAHLVHCEVNACIGHDAQHVGDVSFVKRAEAFSSEDLLGAVSDASILASLPQSETGFKHLEQIQ